MSGNAADAGGGIWNLGTITMNDSASVSGNTADSVGGILNNIEATISQSGSSTVSGNQGGEIHQIEDPRVGMSGEGFAAMAKLILVAIAAGALIARPWVRATALAVITGFMASWSPGIYSDIWPRSPRTGVGRSRGDGSSGSWPVG